MMAGTRAQRRRLFVDRQVQGSLLLRAAGYWVFCLLTVSLMVMCWGVLTGPRAPAAVTLGRLGVVYAPAFLASLVLLPMVLVDCTRFSNRFVGPILRFRRSLRSLANGERVAPIKFREGDYWHDIAESFNDLLARMQNESSPEQVHTDAPSDGTPESEETQDEPEPVGMC
jgi:hypothetical protein